MSSLPTLLDCLFPHLDPRSRNKYCNEYDETDSYDSDDDSFESDDDDASVASSADEAEQEAEEQAQVRIFNMSNLGQSNIFRALQGREHYFQQIMKRGSETPGGVGPNGKTIDSFIQTLPTSESTVNEGDEEHPMSNIKPIDMLKSILESQGCSTVARSYESLTDFFVKPTPEQIAAYDMTVVSAVRRGDLDTLKQLYESGRDLQCCNQFHESIVHTVARRGHTAVLRFLLNEANCTLRVCCDNGRSPLHDACWTTSPNFDCIRVILRECPDFLLIADNRNFTPLEYIPRDCWGQWCSFLDENRELLTPKVLF